MLHCGKADAFLNFVTPPPCTREPPTRDRRLLWHMHQAESQCRRNRRWQVVEFAACNGNFPASNIESLAIGQIPLTRDWCHDRRNDAQSSQSREHLL